MVETTADRIQEARASQSKSVTPKYEMSAKVATKFLEKWHDALDTSGSEKNDEKHLANRGDRALLRRCHTIDDVLHTPVFFKVRHELTQRGVRVGDDERLASVLGLLARVKVNKEGRFSRQLARKRKDSNDAKLSGLRFRRLLQINDRAKLYEKMIGVVRLLDGAVNVSSFAKDIYYWEPNTSSTVRKRWAEEYYSAAPEEI